MIVAYCHQVTSPYVTASRVVEDDAYLVAVVLLRPLYSRTERESVLRSIADELAAETTKEVWVTADLDLWSKCDRMEASDLVAVLARRHPIE